MKRAAVAISDTSPIAAIDPETLSGRELASARCRSIRQRRMRNPARTPGASSAAEDVSGDDPGEATAPGVFLQRGWRACL